MRSKAHFTPALIATCAVAFAACGSSDASNGTSSVRADVVTIRLGTVEGKSAPYADDVEHFASSVESMSNGSLRVEVVWEAARRSDAQSEKALAAMVGHGDLDLAVVPSRVWDQLGVTTLQALQTPLLIDRMDLVDGIAESNIAGEMMAGLGAAGVEGLALWPDSLRHPVSFGAPLVTADGFRGAQLRVPMSDLSYEIVRTMGANPLDPPDWAELAASGDLDGAESAFAWSHDLPVFGTFTANITLFPKVNTVVANQKMFGALPAARQDILRQAARETLDYVESTNPSERTMAAGYCNEGGGVALASDGALSGLTRLVEPVVAELEHQAGTKRIIGEIRAMKDEMSDGDPPLATCARQQPQSSEPTDTAVPATPFPEGVYRADLPEEGVITHSYIDGVWQRFTPNGTLDCEASYVIRSGRIFLTMSTEKERACGGVPGAAFLDAAWTIDAGQLRLVDVHSDPSAAREFSLPWAKVDDG